MSDNYLGQITMFACNFAPNGWALCQGQTLPISQYTALFALLGTQFGGNGTSNFQLPDLRGRVAVGAGSAPGLSSYLVGEMGGTENVTLLTANLPAHNHGFPAYTGAGGTPNPAGALPAQGDATGRHGQGVAFNLYNAATASVTLAPGQLSATGGNLPHNNIQPVLGMNWCIAMQGVFPPRS
ncbi:MAG TPA: tail fiber protein [Acetobacteraceae bacterium]|jgi:microcystin-dependent protein|nr:tail fiber protein [Acetobacteraceae bacterium]